jgi:dTDP-4-dehydrorhamnose 3,5-epimerase-like enzyme
METFELPCMINLPTMGSPELGYITVAEPGKVIPFDVKRVYWTYYTPHHVIRGQHAHRSLEQILVAVNGEIRVDLEDTQGHRYEFLLNEPHKALYIPSMMWRIITFSHDAVLLCLASKPYEESDYIRNYEEFKRQIL